MSGETAAQAAAFGALSDETRVSILRELYAAVRAERGHETAVSYSDLQRAVGAEDSGRFNYHLEQLVGRFVERTDDGYELREAGRAVARLLHRGTLTGGAEFEPRPVETACRLCGGPLRVAYDDQHLVVTCEDCPGVFGDHGGGGLHAAMDVPPSAVGNRDAAALLAVAVRRFEHRAAMSGGGTCPECCGRVRTELQVCAAHDPAPETWDYEPRPTEPCAACGRVVPVVAATTCESCDRWRFGPPVVAAADDQTVRRLLAERLPAGGWARFAAARWLPTGLRRGEDGWRVELSSPDGDGTVAIDGSLSVVEESAD